MLPVFRGPIDEQDEAALKEKLAVIVRRMPRDGTPEPPEKP
jgi:hypothetical protein